MTPAGTSNELDVQNKWEENTHTHTLLIVKPCRATTNVLTFSSLTGGCSAGLDTFRFFFKQLKFHEEFWVKQSIMIQIKCYMLGKFRCVQIFL